PSVPEAARSGSHRTAPAAPTEDARRFETVPAAWAFLPRLDTLLRGLTAATGQGSAGAATQANASAAASPVTGRTDVPVMRPGWFAAKWVRRGTATIGLPQGVCQGRRTSRPAHMVLGAA